MGRPDPNDDIRGRRSSANEAAGDGGQEEAARYLAAVVANLGQIAHRHKLDTLGFLLDMAQMEAEEIVRLHALHGPS